MTGKNNRKARLKQVSEFVSEFTRDLNEEECFIIIYNNKEALLQGTASNPEYAARCIIEFFKRNPIILECMENLK